MTPDVHRIAELSINVNSIPPSRVARHDAASFRPRIFMSEWFTSLAQRIAASGAHDSALYLLGNVPGLPPIVQTVHLLSIAMVLGSIVLLDLRVLGLAAPGQSPSEMAARLAPWTWSALVLLLLSGLIFVLARPRRYFTNPVFAIKFALLLPALWLSFALYRRLRDERYRRVPARVLAAGSLIAWIGVILAGRWIAYADYLFVPEE
jgi:hypothetical protein